MQRITARENGGEGGNAGVTGMPGRPAGHSFTPPIIMPWTKYLCKKG